MGFKRSDRVADLIKEEIASMVMRGGIKDPRIGFVTITKVKLSDDLKQGRVFFSMMGSEEEIKKSKEGFESASGYIRKTLAGQLRLRHVPHLTFEFDSSLEYAAKIEKLIEEIKKEGAS